jgi:hypothetical protein
MLYSATIKQNGTIETEVIDREGTECSRLRQFIGGVGEIISDEETGPECDEVREIETN